MVGIVDLMKKVVGVSSADEEGALSPHEALALSRDADLHFIDVREVHECAKDGTAPGAVNQPLQDAQFEDKILEIANQSKDAPIVLICLSGMRSSKARHQLQDFGFANVRHVTGGMMRWQSEGLPIVE